MSGGREAQLTTEMLSIVNGLVFDGVGPEPVECPIHTEGGRIVGLEGPPPEAARVPTLIAYDAVGRRGTALGLPAVSDGKNREVLDAGLSSIDIARRAGVRIGLGTDLVGDLEDEQLIEFRIRCEVDTVADVLRSATSVNAAILQRPDLGVIREGAAADLLVLNGNPFERADVLWSPERLVIRSGRLVDP